MKHEVVVFDPAGSLPEGKVFQQDLRLGEAKRRGVVTLQVDAQLRKVALSPWAKFVFGDGIELNIASPSFAGFAALWLGRERAAVYWAAMVRFRPEEPPTGLLRLLGDARQPPLFSAPVGDSADNRQTLDKPVIAGDDWAVVSGSVPCQTSTEGVYAFALHGFGRGDRRDPKGGSKPVPATLAWLAVSQA